MDAGTLSIKTIFGQDRRHLVPLFQRPYVWKRDAQWEPLWEDMRAVADRLVGGQPVRSHFLGAIVLDYQRKPTGHVETRLLIDGQQRLTTIQILLEAFCDRCDRPRTELYHKALLKLTRNDDPLSQDEDEQFKIWPTNVDQEHFRRVMLAGSPKELREAYPGNPVEVGHAIADAYLFFYEVIDNWLGPDASSLEKRVEALYTALREHVRMVVIDLGQEDDPQLIFETLNARGTPLLPSDLVKNFLFHEAQTQGREIESLYDEYWKAFDENPDYWREELGRGHARRARIDTFLQHYLTLRTQDDVSVGHLYAAFQQYARSKGALDPVAELGALRSYADTYRRFDEMKEGTSEALFFARLGVMDITTAYPFLLELYVTHGKQKDVVRAVLADLESFLVRRMVCQLSTRGYNRLFVELLPALGGPSSGVRDQVRTFLSKSDAESTRWPKDAELKEAWLNAPIYRVLQRVRVRMVLEALERQLNEGKTEKVSFGEKLTIEHLLPQEWHSHWPLPKDDDRERAEGERNQRLQTMGNLTLLTKKLNPSVSNGPWKKKRPEIIKYTLLRTNHTLSLFEHWDEDQIRARGLELFEGAKKIWPRPKP